VFWQVYHLFLNKTPIEAQKQLESFNVTDDELTKLIENRELKDRRYISLSDNKIIFDVSESFTWWSEFKTER